MKYSTRMSGFGMNPMNGVEWVLIGGVFPFVKSNVAFGDTNALLAPSVGTGAIQG